MANKIFGVKNITHLLYGLIVLLPMFAILGRVIYTQSNPYAKDSYYIENEQTTEEIKTIDNLVEGTTYELIVGGYTTSYTYNNIDLSITDAQLINNTAITEYTTTNILRLAMVSGNPYAFYYSDSTYITDNGFLSAYPRTFKFKFLGYITTNRTFPEEYDKFKYVVKNNNAYLDNAFEYSLKLFTDDNNLGEVDMFSWFTDLFLDHSNAHNQIYIGFVNWYLNYTMLVSCGYLFFLVLIWFINFVRRILDKSMYQDYGGF